MLGETFLFIRLLVIVKEHGNIVNSLIGSDTFLSSFFPHCKSCKLLYSNVNVKIVNNTALQTLVRCRKLYRVCKSISKARLNFP